MNWDSFGVMMVGSLFGSGVHRMDVDLGPIFYLLLFAIAVGTCSSDSKVECKCVCQEESTNE